MQSSRLLWLSVISGNLRCVLHGTCKCFLSGVSPASFAGAHVSFQVVRFMILAIAFRAGRSRQHCQYSCFFSRRVAWYLQLLSQRTLASIVGFHVYFPLLAVVCIRFYGCRCLPRQRCKYCKLIMCCFASLEFVLLRYRKAGGFIEVKQFGEEACGNVQFTSCFISPLLFVFHFSFKVHLAPSGNGGCS